MASAPAISQTAMLELSPLELDRVGHTSAAAPTRAPTTALIAATPSASRHHS